MCVCFPSLAPLSLCAHSHFVPKISIHACRCVSFNAGPKELLSLPLHLIAIASSSSSSSSSFTSISPFLHLARKASIKSRLPHRIPVDLHFIRSHRSERPGDHTSRHHSRLQERQSDLVSSSESPASPHRSVSELLVYLCVGHSVAASHPIGTSYSADRQCLASAKQNRSLLLDHTRLADRPPSLASQRLWRAFPLLNNLSTALRASGSRPTPVSPCPSQWHP